MLLLQFRKRHRILCRCLSQRMGIALGRIYVLIEVLRFWQLRVLWWLGFGDGVVKLDENTNYDGCLVLG